MQGYGLVLAGGGAKGAYQIGAWKAMRELNIRIDAIVGVSIGAINGAMIAQGDYEDTLKLWSGIDVKSGVNLSGELRDPNNLFSWSNMPQLAYEIFKKGGVDATPAREIVAAHVDEARVRASGIPFGLAAFQLSELRPVEMFLEDMPEGQLIDYLMASSRFPGLARQGPDNGVYLDGGFYDNAPISMLRKRGFNRLIVVDISGLKGIGHKQDISCAEIVYIRPFDMKELGESFEFEKVMTEKRIKMGYLDAKKAFGVLAGQFYYFTPREFYKLQKAYGCEAADELENLALEYELPRLTVYTEAQFLAGLWERIAAWDENEDGEEPQEEQEEQEGEGFELRRFFSVSGLHKRGRRLLKKLSFYKTNKKYARAVEVLEDLFGPLDADEAE